MSFEILPEGPIDPEARKRWRLASIPQRAQFGKERLLPDGFHDHGNWLGPCSIDRHRVICHGLAFESFWVSLYRAMTSVKWVDGEPLCLCCRLKLVDEQVLL